MSRTPNLPFWGGGSVTRYHWTTWPLGIDYIFLVAGWKPRRPMEKEENSDQMSGHANMLIYLIELLNSRSCIMWNIEHMGCPIMWWFRKVSIAYSRHEMVLDIWNEMRSWYCVCMRYKWWFGMLKLVSQVRSLDTLLHCKKARTRALNSWLSYQNLAPVSWSFQVGIVIEHEHPPARTLRSIAASILTESSYTWD